MPLYEQVSVWESRDGTLHEYVCVRELATGRYRVVGELDIPPVARESVESFVEWRRVQQFALAESLVGFDGQPELDETHPSFETVEAAIDRFREFSEEMDALVRDFAAEQEGSETDE